MAELKVDLRKTQIANRILCNFYLSFFFLFIEFFLKLILNFIWANSLYTIGADGQNEKSRNIMGRGKSSGAEFLRY